MSIPIKAISRNPANSFQVNPARNWQINPARNWQINPARNWQINPARNWQINPARNWQIYPARNWQINPARNWQINPARNMQVNPVHNIMIDPFRSLNIPGCYVNNVQDFTCTYFTVKAETQDVFLIFDANRIFSFFAAGNAGCYAVYTVATFEYVGFLCPNGAGKYNWFDLNGNWLYFLT